MTETEEESFIYAVVNNTITGLLKVIRGKSLFSLVLCGEISS